MVLIAVLPAGAQPLCLSLFDPNDITICPACVDDLAPPDFSTDACERRTVEDIDPRGAFIWIRTGVPLTSLRRRILRNHPASWPHPAPLGDIKRVGENFACNIPALTPLRSDQCDVRQIARARATLHWHAQADRRHRYSRQPSHHAKDSSVPHPIAAPPLTNPPYFDA